MCDILLGLDEDETFPEELKDLMIQYVCHVIKTPYPSQFTLIYFGCLKKVQPAQEDLLYAEKW